MILPNQERRAIIMSFSIEWTENEAASLLWGSNKENEKRGGEVDEG